MLMSRSDKSRSNMHVFRTLLTSALLLLCSLTSYANEYRLNAASTSWSWAEFTVSAEGFYEYYETTVTPEFWFNLGSHTSGNILATSVATSPGFNGTDIASVGGSSNGMYYVDPSPDHYYVIVWYPNTAMNSNNYPAICASTSLPAEIVPCSAPNHVDVSGAYHFFPGETILLTAQAYSSAGTGNPITNGVTYQWQKYIGSAFADIAGATDATYTKVHATVEDVGQYRCIASTGDGCTTASATTKDTAFKLKCLQLYVYYNNQSDYCNLYLAKVDATHAMCNVYLPYAGYTYYFKITDGQNNWWGNSGTMNSGNCTNWTLGVNNYCGLTTTKAATYTFNLTFNAGLTSYTMSVVYPGSDQSAGYNLYFANDVRQWNADNIHYRIGTSSSNDKFQMSKVIGTDNLFYVTTPSLTGFDAWHVANNACWSGNGNSIYLTKTGDAYAANEAVRFEGAPIPSGGWTVIPGNDYTIGGDSQNDNCKFYSFSTVPGMWTHNVSIVPPSYGTLTVNYTSPANEALAFNTGNRDLPHTCYCYVTAEEGTGYTLATLTVNGTPIANRAYFILTEDAVVEATFTPATYTVTLNTNGGTINSGNVTSYTYGVGATLPTDVTKSGSYIFAGWYDNAGCTGSAVTEISTTDTGNKTYWAKWDAVTIVDIPGTVNKGNVYTYTDGMTWYGASDEYFNIGDGDHPNLDRSVEWIVNLTVSGNYIVTEEYSCPNGHRVLLELLDAGRNVVASYETQQFSGPFTGERTYDALWNLNSVPTGVYTLRLRNVYSYSQPKEKSFTFSHAGLSVSYTKVPNQALYGKDGDSKRAYGEISEPTVVTTTGITIGATVDSTGNVLTIGGVTITAPLVTTGKLYDIPKDDPSAPNVDGCDWRFRCWRNLPATITGDVSTIEAVYFPTFDVDYQTNGGTIYDPEPYTHWYEYTGRVEDQTPLPADVRKDGYVFAGWYQNSTTRLFPYLTGNYYGDYARSEGCESDACDYRLKAHWVLPCDEPQTISKVVLTGSGTTNYTYEGYNGNEYAGTPIVSVGSTTASFDVDNDGNEEVGYKLEANGTDIVFATLRKGDFRVGDHIYVAITAENDSRVISSTTDGLTLYFGTGAADAQLLVNVSPVDRGIVSYTLDADDVLKMNEAHATGVGVFRESTNGENPCVYSVEIKGCRDLIFDDNHGTGVWSDPLNWAPTYHEIPSHYQATRIIRPCTVNIADAHALNAKLCKGNGNNGSLTINANAALEVVQRVSTVQGNDYNTLLAVAAEDLVIKSNASNQGALAHGDEGSNTHATIEFYGRGSGYGGGADATWQYMGVPFSDVSHAIDHYYGSEMARWYENETGNAGENWKWVDKPEALVPFVGYALTNPSAKIFTNQGTLVPSVNQTISLTCGGTNYKGWNFLANSWMAPINITKFIASDFGDAEQTIYLFNTGINDGHQATQPETTSAGQYVAVPILSAGSMLADNRYIAPMQGFYVVTESATSMTLRYNLVRNDEHGALSTRPNRAPRMANGDENDSQMPRIIVDVTGNRFSDRLYLFENTDQTNAFDNGWDGYKFEGEDYAPQLMTRTGDMDLAVDVSPAFEGKQIAFRAGEDTEYTLHFSTTENGLVLRDLVTDVVTPIEDGGTYHFFASNRESAIRFVIGDNRQVPTGFDEQSVLTSDQILSLSVYTADGRLVLRRTSDFDDPLLLPQSGVYIFYMQTTAGVKIQKITF